MLVQIHLDRPHAHFTNLDVITGKVILQNPTTNTVSSIVVKLEGESRSRLFAPPPDRLGAGDIHRGRGRGDVRTGRQRAEIEVHKILYKTQVVYPQDQPPEDIAQKTAYPLEAGQYEYPFQFKLPLNNSCLPANSLATNVNFATLEVAKTPTQHVKQTLPPSLNGFPGEAEIRYYVKVTVNRPQFYKENPRSVENFTFLPIEPPRPAHQDGEAYARRSHQFLDSTPEPLLGKKKSLFDSFRKDPSPSTSTSSETPPRFTVDARLPNPAILTCNKHLPLRLLVKNNSERSKNVYLQNLQVELIGYTKVKAHEVQRTESNSWIVTSMSNMAIPIGSPNDPVGTEVPINPEYWYYELEVRVGLGYGSYEHGHDQLVVLPLRLPVQIYSGISPPPALLKAISIVKAKKISRKEAEATGGVVNLPAPQVSTQPSSSAPVSHNLPPQSAPMDQGPHAPPYDEPPPSYEDAVGQDLPPIDGYRGEYQPPPIPEGESSGFPSDHKRG